MSDANRPTDVEIAWAAGLFEGEGCISTTKHELKSGTHLYIKMSLSMTDFDVVEKFARIVGAGNLTPKRRGQEHWKDQLQWQCGSRTECTRILFMLAPHFGTRRRERMTEVLLGAGAYGEVNA